MHNIELETKDLIIRKEKKDDYKSLLKNYWSKEKTAKFMLWKPIFTDAEAIERIEKTINFELPYNCGERNILKIKKEKKKPKEYPRRYEKIVKNPLKLSGK